MHGKAKKIMTLLCLLLCVSLSAQTITSQDWRVENEGHYGSFWWKVERSEHRMADGMYYYYIYTQSNSYLNQKTYGGASSNVKATTYLENVTITMLDRIKSYEYNLPFDYLLFDWEKFYVAYLYHQAPNKQFGIEYYNIYPYSYSKTGKY